MNSLPGGLRQALHPIAIHPLAAIDRNIGTAPTIDCDCRVAGVGFDVVIYYRNDHCPSRSLRHHCAMTTARRVHPKLQLSTITSLRNNTPTSQRRHHAAATTPAPTPN
jgi:hypothetical protein